MSKERGKWDKPVFGGFPVGVYMQTIGANRYQRRKSREHQNDPTPPSSMVPAIKRITDTGDTEYVAAW